MEWKPSGMLNKNTIYHSLTNPALLWGKKNNTELQYLLNRTQQFWVLPMVPKIVHEKQVIFQRMPPPSSHPSLKVRQQQGRL